MKKQLKSILKTKVRNRKVKFINDTKDVVVFFDEELYKFSEWFTRTEITPNGTNSYKTFFDDQIEAFGTKEDMEAIIAAKKYNL